MKGRRWLPPRTPPWAPWPGLPARSRGKITIWTVSRDTGELGTVVLVTPGIAPRENVTNETTLTDGPQCFLPLQLAMDWVRIRITLALSDYTFQVLGIVKM